MLYGANMLSTVPGVWAIEHGTMSPTAISLEAGGIARQELTVADLAAMPEQLLVAIAATRFTDTYAPDCFVFIHVETVAGTSFDYTVPIIDTGSNMCSIVIPATSTEYSKLTFSLKAEVAITILEWGLFVPLTQSVDFTAIEGKIPRLLRDYNIAPFDVSIPEDIVALISAYITEATEMSGHLSLSYFAAAESTLIIRIRDNEIEELYSPAYFNLSAGKGTIGLPHAYLNKLAGYHNFTVTAQVSSGSVSIDTRKILYVIDGAHFAYSLLDVGSIAVDLTAKQLVSDSRISSIWAACIDDDICLIKSCDYSNVLADAWISTAIIGPAIDAAIEFDGTWDISNYPYRFNTAETPWIGWVTPTGTLNVKQLDNELSLQVLASDVIAVCSVKGWNNEYTPGIDQGLIFAYVKVDGLVYLRARCLQADGTRFWENEQVIIEFVGTAIDINAFRTDDFRVGFNVLDNAGITHTYITKRNWPGMATPAEYLTAAIASISISTTEIQYLDFQTVEHLSVAALPVVEPLYVNSPVMLFAENYARQDGDYGYMLRLKFDERVRNTFGTESSFTITDFYGTVFYGAVITENYNELLIEFSNLNNASNPVTVAYTPGTATGDIVALAADSLVINLVGLVPYYAPSPIPLFVYNEGAKKVIITFDKPVMSSNWVTTKNGFRVTAQEYDMIAPGTASLKTYEILTAKNLTEVDTVTMSIANAALTDTIISNNAITLMYNT